MKADRTIERTQRIDWMLQGEVTMINLPIQQKIVELLVLINAAITNQRLYPPASAIITNAIDRLYRALAILFEEIDSIVLAEAEKNILINGETLNQKEMERPPVKAFLEFLLQLKIRSITIERGIEPRELRDFLKIIVDNRDAVLAEGEFQKMIDDRGLPHILVDKKLYIAKDGNRRIVAGLDIKDDDIIQHLTGSNPDIRIDASRLREMANDPEWVSQIFKKGMEQALQQRKLLSDMQLSRNLIHMIGIFEKIVENLDQDMISLFAGKAFANLDSDMISLILTYDIDHFFNGKLFQNILDNMDEEKFGEVVDRIKIMETGLSASPMTESTEGRKTFERTYKRLASSDKGVSLQQKREEKQTREKNEKERQLKTLKEEVETILRNEAESFQNDHLMASLPDLADRSLECGDEESFDALIQHLEKGLLNHEQTVRDRASKAFAQVIERLPQDRQTAVMGRLTDTLVKWIATETLATSAYKKICRSLKDRIANCIDGKHFSGCIPALDIFHRIDAGLLDKNDTAQTIASQIIRDLASPERMDILFEAFDEKEGEIRNDAGKVLARLGDAPLNRLLDLLRDQTDSTERVRILHLLIEIGQPTIPVIRERLDHDEPWYFLRNLVYVLGRINSQTSVELLGSFLRHKHEKVRQEALQSILRIGGNKRGSVLLSALSEVEESFRMSIIQELGNAKYAEAVPVLLELLKARPLLQSPSKTELDERICIALGRIGSQEAVPLLTEISRQKAFFAIKKPYPDKVKAAAAKALTAIER